MSADTFDTIVVGARCAGASLAIRLARAGQRVLLLDASKLPSDQPMSTHVVSEVGMEWLDELGVGPAVRESCPPCFGLRLDMNGVVLDLPFRDGRAGHVPRRFTLDRLLEEAAVRAGADLRDWHKVVGLIREGGRVCGVEAVHDGVKHAYRARVVVGADGRHSDVAELAGAKEYQGYDSERFGYWAYWPVNAAWSGRLREFGLCISFDGESNILFAFQTAGDQVLLGVLSLLRELPKWKGRHAEAYVEFLRASPFMAPLVENNAPVGEVLGLLKARYGYREAAGPGFALVGDAGLHKDPTPGFGITDALRDARSLAPAILAGGDEALVRYWRQRDVASCDLFHFAHDMSSPAYVNPLNQAIYRLANRSPRLVERLQAQARREISPYEAVPLPSVLRAMAGALLRGHVGVLPTFLAAGQRGVEVKRVRAERQAALDALPPAPIASAPARAAE